MSIDPPEPTPLDWYRHSRDLGKMRDESGEPLPWVIEFFHLDHWRTIRSVFSNVDDRYTFEKAVEAIQWYRNSPTCYRIRNTFTDDFIPGELLYDPDANAAWGKRPRYATL